MKWAFTEAVIRELNHAIPVTSMLAPVMYRESSEARKAQTSATSGGQTEEQVLETECVIHIKTRYNPQHFLLKWK